MSDEAGQIEFTVEEVKALLGCIHSQLKVWDHLDLDKHPTMREIKPHLLSAFKKITAAAKKPGTEH